MNRLLENRLRLVDLEFRQPEFGRMRDATAVGAAAHLVEAEVLIDNLVADISPGKAVLETPSHDTYALPMESFNLPVTLATAVFLHLLGVRVGMTALGEESREVFSGSSRAFGNALAVTIVGFVGARHCSPMSSAHSPIPSGMRRQ